MVVEKKYQSWKLRNLVYDFSSSSSPRVFTNRQSVITAHGYIILFLQDSRVGQSAIRNWSDFEGVKPTVTAT
jgi:hypothetical protein